MNKIISKRKINKGGAAQKIEKPHIILALYNIRSTHNVGAIFRTADAANVSEILLVGITPDPLDRFGRKRNDIAKAALGAENTVFWRHFNDKEFLQKLTDFKNEKFQIISLEQSKNSVDYKKVKVGKKAVIVLGSEVDGLPKEILAKSDIVAEIPMLGKKESLNVSVAAGIALFRILNI